VYRIIPTSKLGLWDFLFEEVKHFIRMVPRIIIVTERSALILWIMLLSIARNHVITTKENVCYTFLCIASTEQITIFKSLLIPHTPLSLLIIDRLFLWLLRYIFLIHEKKLSFANVTHKDQIKHVLGMNHLISETMNHFSISIQFLFKSTNEFGRKAKIPPFSI
jgi:hypothetical protein